MADKDEGTAATESPKGGKKAARKSAGKTAAKTGRASAVRAAQAKRATEGTPAPTVVRGDKAARTQAQTDRPDERPDYEQEHAERTGRADDVPMSTGRGR